MIRVSRMLSQPCYYLANPCGTPYVGPGAATTNYTVYMGNSLLISRAGGGYPLSEVTEVNFGFLHQGDQVMGRLKDKDVQHLSAYGDLTVNGVWPSSPLYTYAAATFGPLAKNITMNNGTVVQAVHNFAHWGVNCRFEYATYVPRYLRYQVPQKYVAAQYVPWSDTYTWSDDGRWGMVLSVCTDFDSQVRTGYYEDGTTWQALNYGAIRFFSSARKGYPGLWSTNSFQLAWDANGAYINPGGLGKRYVKNLSPVLTANGLSEDWLGALAFNVSSPTYCQWEGSTDVANTLVNFLQSSTLVGMAGRTFSANPVVFNWSDLTIDLLKQQRHVDSSLLLTLVDFASLRVNLESWADILKFIQNTPSRIKSIKSMADLFRQFKKTSKVAADAELSYKYGISPTVRDGQALARGLHTLAKYAVTPSRKHARRTSVESGAYGSPIQSTNVLTAEVDSLPRDFLGNSERLIQALDSWGMFPRASMLYDIIPFSFALDWFVNFGSVIERVDYNVGAGSIQYFPIQYVIYGSKRRWSPDPTKYLPRNLTGVSGTITFTWYDRYLSLELPAPPVKFDETGSFRSWAEATALIVQKWK